MEKIPCLLVVVFERSGPFCMHKVADSFMTATYAPAMKAKINETRSDCFALNPLTAHLYVYGSKAANIVSGMLTNGCWPYHYGDKDLAPAITQKMLDQFNTHEKPKQRGAPVDDHSGTDPCSN